MTKLLLSLLASFIFPNSVAAQMIDAPTVLSNVVPTSNTQTQDASARTSSAKTPISAPCIAYSLQPPCETVDEFHKNEPREMSEIKARANRDLFTPRDFAESFAIGKKDFDARDANKPQDKLATDVKDENSDDDDEVASGDLRFRWKSALNQSLMFLGVQHGYAMTQPKTRRDLKGKFFKDYFDSVKSLGGWEDGGRFFTNYIAHPMQGALTGYIQIQNDPRGIKQRFGADKAYWKSRMKAMAWSAAWSTQFEIGLVSQASIGNVGLHGKQTWEDILVTPTVGTGLVILEDAIDRYTRPFIESRSDNKYVRIFSRMLLNPTRNFANLLRFEKPWKRDVTISK